MTFEKKVEQALYARIAAASKQSKDVMSYAAIAALLAPAVAAAVDAALAVPYYYDGQEEAALDALATISVAEGPSSK